MPLAGGRARGTARTRPWGGRPVPSLIKLIPNVAQHEAAQGNYNINKLMMNRCSGGLFAASRHFSGPPQVRRVRPSGPTRRRPAYDATGARARGDRASRQKLHVNVPIDQDHELITSGALAAAGFRHTKGLRTARTSERVSEVPTLDQPREACQARPERLGRQLIGARMVARLTYLPATAPRDGAPFACLDCDPLIRVENSLRGAAGCPRRLRITNDSLEQLGVACAANRAMNRGGTPWSAVQGRMAPTGSSPWVILSPGRRRTCRSSSGTRSAWPRAS